MSAPAPRADGSTTSPAVLEGPVLVEIVRGGLVESVHRGSAVVLDARGALAGSVGRPESPIYPRSSVKPLQAIGMVAAGLDLTGPALAMAGASHSGEAEHVACVQETLAANGLTEDDLTCPLALPMNEAARDAHLAAGGGPRRSAMNCSGKHTAMLVTCQRAGWPIEGYAGPEHPLQQHLRSVIADYTGQQLPRVTVDGCGAPLFAMSLSGLAAAFGRILTEADSDPDGPAGRVAGAMRAHPFHVAGSGRDDTDLMIGVAGLLSKGGAEGVHVVAMPGRGAVAVKVADGNDRGRVPVIVAGLEILGVQGAVLEQWARADVLGGGAPVGELRAVPGLVDLLRAGRAG